jgi:hypothetical protein
MSISTGNWIGGISLGRVGGEVGEYGEATDYDGEDGEDGYQGFALLVTFEH